MAKIVFKELTSNQRDSISPLVEGDFLVEGDLKSPPDMFSDLKSDHSGIFRPRLICYPRQTNSGIEDRPKANFNPINNQKKGCKP